MVELRPASTVVAVRSIDLYSIERNNRMNISYWLPSSFSLCPKRRFSESLNDNVRDAL